MHFPHLRSLLAPKVPVSWEGQCWARPGDRLVFAGGSKPGGCEEAFGVWVVLGLTPASVGLILPPWKNQGSPARCAPSKLHQLPVFKQPKATLRLTLSTSSFFSCYWRCSSLPAPWETRALEAGRSLPGFGGRGSVNGRSCFLDCH